MLWTFKLREFLNSQKICYEDFKKQMVLLAIKISYHVEFLQLFARLVSLVMYKNLNNSEICVSFICSSTLLYSF